MYMEYSDCIWEVDGPYDCLDLATVDYTLLEVYRKNPSNIINPLLPNDEEWNGIKPREKTQCEICEITRGEGNVCRECREHFREMATNLWDPDCYICDHHGFPCQKCSKYFGYRLGTPDTRHSVAMMSNILLKYKQPENEGFYACANCGSTNTTHSTKQFKSENDAAITVNQCFHCGTRQNYQNRTLQCVEFFNKLSN